MKKLLTIAMLATLLVMGSALASTMSKTPVTASPPALQPTTITMTNMNVVSAPLDKAVVAATTSNTHEAIPGMLAAAALVNFNVFAGLATEVAGDTSATLTNEAALDAANLDFNIHPVPANVNETDVGYLKATVNVICPLPANSADQKTATIATANSTNPFDDTSSTCTTAATASPPRANTSTISTTARRTNGSRGHPAAVYAVIRGDQRNAGMRPALSI